MTRFEELASKVDAFFARVADRHGADMQCATGCSDCCHVRLTLTAVEAAAIRAHVAAWPAEQRRNLANQGPSDRCAGLDAAGRCRIYPARPLVCRSHGVPIRLRGALPVVQACHRNFTRTEPDPDCVLDQATLSATLYAVERSEMGVGGPAGSAGGAGGKAPRGIDAADAAARGGDPGQRIDLAALLADLAAI